MNHIKFENLDPLDFGSSEAYKSLRSNIQFCGEDIKVITFTSCLPNEGKSVLTFHLGVAMAEAGKKILLIDADIRKSVLLGRLQVDKVAKGLSEYLTGQCSLEDCLCATNVENMDMIFTGPVAPNPSELLGSDKFSDLLKRMRDQYDYVLIDSPPLGSVIDSAVTASKSDGAVLVIESNVVSYKFAQQVKEQLERTGCRILGAVLNKVSVEKGGYYRKGYGYSSKYGYGYGYGYGKDAKTKQSDKKNSN